jgi:hypothetical protein
MHDTVTKNFWINGYNGVWTIDHDDGSQYWNDTRNLMIFGGCKNYMGHSKSCDHNIIVNYPMFPLSSSSNFEASRIRLTASPCFQVFPGDYDDKGVQRGSNPCQTDDNSGELFCLFFYSTSSSQRATLREILT